MKGTVIAVCISERKGVKKHPVPSVTVKEHHGIIGDAHAGDWHRQISLLADESVDKMREKGAVLQAGDFAENILTKGIDLKNLPIGTHMTIGEAELEVTGKCVMPTEGIFAIVIKGGKIQAGDAITI